MQLMTRQIPALWNGVSQQPAPVRLSSQCEAEVNVSASIVDGLRKRGPAEHIAKLTGDRLGTAHLHTINRDTVERYTVIVTPTGIRVFDMAGVEKTVTAPLGWGYLAISGGLTARRAYTCMTVADYTFVLNKTKKVAMGAVGADLNPPSDSYWWLNRPLESQPSGMPTQLYTETRIVDEPPETSNPSTTSPTTNPAPYSTNPAGALTGTVQTLQDLPTTAAEGAIYAIVGTNESNFQTYYVVKKSGSWYETVKPGLKNLIDANTMPHALVRQGDGTFIFGPFAWMPRRVGDYKTNPNPTFVGRTIRDMFFHRNRFGVCVDENVVLSRTGDFGNFYRYTVTDYLPDEVVDVAASETKVTKMEFAVPFQGSLMLFSDQTQFRLSHSEAFTGATVSLDVTTQYPMIPGVRPAPAGADVYFASDGSGWGLVREYYVDSESGNSHDASDVTSHVQQYIPYGIHCLTAAPEFDTLFVLTDGAKNRVYVYKYYWQTETEKAQSAWNYWEFESDVTVLAARALGGYLYLLIDRVDGTYLERLPIFYGSLAAGLAFQVYLDRRAEVTGVYNAGTNLTTFTLPYALPTAARGNFRVVLGSAFPEALGGLVTPTWLSTTQFTVPGNYSAGPVVVGLNYTMRHVFSRQYPQNGKGEAIHTGRLQLKTMTVFYTDSAYFRAEIRPYGPSGDTLYTAEFPTRILSVEGLSQVGQPSFATGRAIIPIQANAAEAEIALVNDFHLGCCFHSAEWEGAYHNRARA